MAILIWILFFMLPQFGIFLPEIFIEKVPGVVAGG
jgi:hypothetical protein